MLNICTVPLSDVHASNLELVLKAMLRIDTESAPRLNSLIFLPVAVSNNLISVPFFDAVANILPSYEIAMQLSSLS